MGKNNKVKLKKKVFSTSKQNKEATDVASR